jgi:hypothetical protein
MAKKDIDVKEVFKCIKEGVSASEIMERTGIAIQALRNKAHQLMQIDKTFYDVPGLVGKTGGKRKISYTKNGLKISTVRMETSDFNVDDEFDLKFEEKRIILTKV